ncbi:MAG: GNAT family N-acetyltransferase [Spirochaetae bacterium HGW-Spirochaetae-8]|jgi:GNAT superfamily N-acetyltransferase|nr:MAG: GNAT family N-acetyltransferase [Spirochaetae bacterium HGW-Spirochaetae-8]
MDRRPIEGIAMHLEMKESRDAAILTTINEVVQNLHAREYPQYFKPFNYQAVHQALQEALAKDNWHAYIACIDGIPAGFVLFFIRDYKENPYRYSYRAVHVDQICVLQEFQGEGVGSFLMDAVERFARENGVDQLELTYWEKNSQAARFYRKKGYEPQVNFVVKRLAGSFGS